MVPFIKAATRLFRIRIKRLDFHPPQSPKKESVWTQKGQGSHTLFIVLWSVADRRERERERTGWLVV